MENSIASEVLEELKEMAMGDGGNVKFGEPVLAALREFIFLAEQRVKRVKKRKLKKDG